MADATYQQGRLGHPSTYAGIRLECLPSAELEYQVDTIWPSDFDDDYRAAIAAVVCDGIVESLMCHLEPYLGCSISLKEVRWHPTGSSEHAMYRATKLAIADLLSHGSWRHVY